MLYFPTLISIIEVILVVVPVLLTVAFVTVAERKTMASMQRRLGPNIVGYYGLLQAFADALKLLLKEYVSPTQANLILFFLGPVITLIFSLLGYAVIPYGPGLAIWDFNLGILYMLAVSSLSTYGILLAGWSANSKYAFLGSKWPNGNVNFYLNFSCGKEKKTTNYMREIYKIISLKFIRYFMCNAHKRGSKVKILLNVNNPQVTKAYNSLVGTSEAIRSLSKFASNYSLIYLLSFFIPNNLFTYYLFFLNGKKQCKATPLSIRLERGKSPRFTKLLFYDKRWYTKINQPFLKNTKENTKEWCEWLAGLIDGDGCFYLSKNGYDSLEITMDVRDGHALHIIKNVYGGSVKIVSGQKALRYSLRHKEGLLWVINDVNGKIRNSYRLLQLNKLCVKYNINIIHANKLTYNNGWMSGFFDADGSITLNKTNAQLAITLTQKTNELLQPLPELFNGTIYIDNTNNNSFKWYLSEKQSVLKLLEFFKAYPPKSLKKNRILMIKRCYELKEMSAHKSSDPYLNKVWINFLDKWDKYEQI